MAAMQAEKHQQNDVNSEKSQQDQHLNVRNALLQNGTDKSVVRGGCVSVAISKVKSTGSNKSLGLDMSQYRQEDSGEAENEQGMYASTPPVGDSSPSGSDGHSYGFPFSGRDMHNTTDVSLHPFGQRPSFVSSKPGPYTQQRIPSGQTISQPTGPTPTLNQLLQSSNPMHRYSNSYGHPEQPYNQNWPSQKAVTPYGSSGGAAASPGSLYRTQPSVSIP